MHFKISLFKHCTREQWLLIILMQSCISIAQSIGGNYKLMYKMFESPDKINFANHYFQIIQLTANCHHKLFRVACTDTDVLTSRMSPFTAEHNLTNHYQAGDIVLCSWAKHITLTDSLYPAV